MEDTKNLDYSKEEYINDEVEVFEPDFDFSDELQALSCLCGISSGAGSGGPTNN